MDKRNRRVEIMPDRVRPIREDELPELLVLYQQLNSDDPVLEINESLLNHWKNILSNSDYFYLVLEEDGNLVSTCNMNIIKNLTRQARPYALIENVVTHQDHRKKGYGTAVLHKAVQIAGEHGCYKVMILTSHKDEATLNFYENAGFSRGEKTGFIVRI